jgi:dTDP-L-rhamnose 4-epimerase
VVVHLAAETGTGQSMYEVAKYVDTNVRGTALLLDELVNGRCTIRKVVVASSRAIYGEGKYRCAEHGPVYPGGRRAKDMEKGDFSVKCPLCQKEVELQPTDEDSLLHPTSLYGMTKHDQERMVMSLCAGVGISTVALRYQNVYGPGQSLTNPYTGILSIFSTRIRNGKEVLIFEDGTESRDFVYIDDVVKATIRAIDLEDSGSVALNVGSGVPTTVIEVVDALAAALDAPANPRRITGQFRLGDIRHCVASLEKASRILGYSPSVVFHEGIRRFCQWARQQEKQEDKLDASLRELQERGLLK